MKRNDILIAILVSFAWGSNFIAAKYSIIEVPGFLSLAMRFLISGLILLPFVSKPKITFRELYAASLIFGVFYLGSLYYGLHLGLNTSLTIIMMQLNIPISIIIARIFFKEYFTLNTILGIGIAFVGTVIVVGTPHITGNYFAAIVILFSSFFCAVFNIQNRKFKSVPPLSMVCWTSLIASPHLFLLSYFIEGNPIELIKDTTYVSWIAILYSVIVASFVGIGLWVYLLQQYPVNEVMPFNLLVPFFGVSLSIIYLGDLPSWHIFWGGGLTLSGIAITHARTLPFFKNRRL